MKSNNCDCPKACYYCATPTEKQSEVQCTPTPWRLSLDTTKVLGDVTTEICDFDGSMEHMKRGERVANAEFIVRAVNSHEALLEAAFAVVSDPRISHVANREFMGKLDDLRKAIALAEGGK